MPKHKDLESTNTARICDQFKITDKEFVFIAAYFNAISFTEDFESKGELAPIAARIVLKALYLARQNRVR